MNQNEQGMVYAFRLSGSRMRQSAVKLRRKGQTLDALTLMRRAAEQENTPAAWMALAVELRQSGNWEAASRLLAKVLSRDPGQSGVWIEMARCLQALGQNDVAVDCAYHQLQEDPWGSSGDAARALLAELETIPEGREPRRTQRLIHRGLTAWQSGDRDKGERCVRRALRIAADQERLLVTTAMLCMLEMDFEGALRYLPRALRRNPEDPRTLTALSTLYQQLGKRRLARGLLAKAGRHAESVIEEDGFLTAAWAQDAWPEMQAYLAFRMKKQPHRVPLLTAKAAMCCENGDAAGARQLWRDVMAIDPDDRHARVMLAASQRAPEQLFAMPGMLPRAERRQQMQVLKMAAENLSVAEMLRPGSSERRTLDWFAASSDCSERQAVQELLSGDEPALIPYFKEMLCQPFLRYDMRQWALVRLAELGCGEEMLLLVGSHYTTIACRKVEEGQETDPWRKFLPAFLRETRRYHRSSEMAEFAAEVWRGMPAAQRQHASGAGSYLWCKAMEIMFLCTAGEDVQASRVMRDASLSPRRISRVLRRIHRYLMERAQPTLEMGDTI